jgi:hypothetical protein
MNKLQQQPATATVLAHALDLPPDPVQDPAPGTTMDLKPVQAVAPTPAPLVQASMVR